MIFTCHLIATQLIQLVLKKNYAMHQMVRNVAFSLAISENRRFLAGVV